MKFHKKECALVKGIGSKCSVAFRRSQEVHRLVGSTVKSAKLENSVIQMFDRNLNLVIYMVIGFVFFKLFVRTSQLP